MFHTHSLLCPSKDVPPVSTTLPVRLPSRACWAPDEAARLAVMHRNDNSMQLVVTTYELRAKRSRDEVDILGKDPVGLHVTTIAYDASSTDCSCFLWGTSSFLSVHMVTQQVFPCL